MLQFLTKGARPQTISTHGEGFGYCKSISCTELQGLKHAQLWNYSSFPISLV